MLRPGDGSLTNDYNDMDSDSIEIPNVMVEQEAIITSIFGTSITTSTPEEVAETANKVILSPKNVM